MCVCAAGLQATLPSRNAKASGLADASPTQLRVARSHFLLELPRNGRFGKDPVAQGVRRRLSLSLWARRPDPCFWPGQQAAPSPQPPSTPGAGGDTLPPPLPLLPQPRVASFIVIKTATQRGPF